MNRFSLLIPLTIVSLSSFAQGGADIRYVHAKDIDQSLLNRDLRIDFKSKHGESSTRTADTVTLNIDNKRVTFIEKRKRGVDYWYYNDQYLQSTDQGDKKVMKILDSKIIDINSYSWKLMVTIDSFEGDKRVITETKDILIDPKDVAGVMIKIEK